MKDNKHVILCVDDDPGVLESLKIVLEANDYIVVCATTAEQGLIKYRELSPDLLIIDLMMEEIDSGENLVKDLKAIGNRAPVYILSSVGDEMNATLDCTSLGLAGVFQKPVDNRTLLAVLKTKLPHQDSLA